MGALPINCSRVSRLVPHTYTKDGRRILSPNQGGGPPDLLWLGVTQASPNSGMRTRFPALSQTNKLNFSYLQITIFNKSERRTPSPNQDVYRVLCRMLKRIFRFSFNWALQLSWCSTLLSFSGTNVYNWAFLLACFLDLVSFSYFNVKTISGLRSLLLGILGSYFNTLTQHQATCTQTQGKSRILMFS